MIREERKSILSSFVFSHPWSSTLYALIILDILLLNLSLFYSISSQGRAKMELYDEEALYEVDLLTKNMEGVSKVLKTDFNQKSCSFSGEDMILLTKSRYKALSGIGVNSIRGKNNYIAMSLYGTSPRYTDGAIDSVKLARVFYPGWKFRIYVCTDVPKRVIDSMKEEAETNDVQLEVIMREKDYFGKGSGATIYHGSLWRFEIIDEEKMDNFIIRDCDSRFNLREIDAVRHFLSSNYRIHSMKDHPEHWSVPILGGMWGGKKTLFSPEYSMRNEIISFLKGGEDKFGDQRFLQNVIYPKVKDTCLTHSATKDCAFKHEGATQDFPTERHNNNFIGAICRSHDLRTCQQIPEDFRSLEYACKLNWVENGND